MPRRSDISAARYSGLLAVGYASAALRDQTDKLVLASFASTALVGYYSIAARLASLVMEIIRFFYMPMMTAVGALQARADWPAIRVLYARMMAVVSGLTGGIVVLVAGLSGPLVVLWMGRPIPEVTLMLLLLLPGTACAAMLTGPGTALCRGIGRVGIETTYVIVNLVLNLAVTIALVLTIGAIGTVIASGATWAVSAVIFTFHLHRQLDLPVEATRRAGYTVLLAGTLALSISVISANAGLPQTRGAALEVFLVRGAVAVTVYVVAAFALRLIPRFSVREITGVLRRASER